MSKAVVFGCGPTLTTNLGWPSDALRIGVNRSIEKVYSPICVTADKDFWFSSYAFNHPTFLWIYRDGGQIDPPWWTHGASGAFGLWVASQLGATQVWLVGFGGHGHFYDDPIKHSLAEDLKLREDVNRKMHIGILETEIQVYGDVPPYPTTVAYRRTRGLVSPVESDTYGNLRSDD